jgi:hypothetical protein
LWCPAHRPAPLVAAAAGGQTGRTRDRRGRLIPARAANPEKNELKPWQKRQWSIPPQANAAFGWRMEDVLEGYTRPYAPRYPQVCADRARHGHLNPHTPASRAAAFPPAEVKRRADRLASHSTPKHGRWLNMAEIELSVLSRQGLARRGSAVATRQTEVAAWQARRNTAAQPRDWRFTTVDARITLKRLYPAAPASWRY